MHSRSRAKSGGEITNRRRRFELLGEQLQRPGALRRVDLFVLFSDDFFEEVQRRTE